MDSSLLGVPCACAAEAASPAITEATSQNSVEAANWRKVILFIRSYSLAWNLLVVQGKRGGTLHVPTQPVWNDFHDINLRRRDFCDPAVCLTHVIPGQYAVHETILGFDQPVRAIGHAERADHAQRIERKLFEKLAIATRIRPQPWTRAARTARHERRPEAR